MAASHEAGFNDQAARTGCPQAATYLVVMLPALNWPRKRWSEVQKRRMSGMSNRTMARRSRPSLHRTNRTLAMCRPG